MHEFPPPPAEALALSEQLAALIRQEIAAAAAAMPFSRYMELCLYSPGLGYYSAGAEKFGAVGDFVTAPEISPLFGRCLAQSCGSALTELGGGDVLEFGAGSGRLAADILGALEAAGCLPERYLILEPGADLRVRQQRTLAAAVPHLSDRVAWLDSLPGSGFRGVVLANEVLDAMPVERFRWDGENIERFHVQVTGTGEFDWCLRDAQDAQLTAAIRQLAGETGMETGYVSELNTLLEPWLQSIAGILDRGLVLLADYGYPRREYYHLQRRNGTLMCHYRHRAHTDPFLWPGLQDITAHVDFTAVAGAGAAAGLELAGYTSQAYFLLDCGLEQLLSRAGPADSPAWLQQAQQAKTLLLPGEMGERFKFIGLAKGLQEPVPGFRLHDFRHRL